MKEIVHLYHINDLHSHFGHWNQIKSFLSERKMIHEETGEKAILADIGDHVDRVHPYTDGTLGQCNVELLNEAGFDLATIGNNEGITLPFDALDHLYDKATFTVTVANLFYPNGERPSWAIPYYLEKLPSGTVIAFVGITAFFETLYANVGWQLSDPLEEIANILPQLKEKANVIVLMSHLGLHHDEQIAERFPDIDIILGAHTHHVLHEGKVINQTMLCGAGKFGMYIGHVELELESGKILSKKAHLYETVQDVLTVEEQQLSEELGQKGKISLSEPVLKLNRRLDISWFEPSKLADILCEGLREWCKADCAFLNAGLILEHLPEGEITKYDIHQICPHPINPCVLTLKGSELKTILNQTRNENWPHIQIKGFGFRGKVMGIMVYDRIEWKQMATGKIEWLIDKQALEEDRVYRLAIPGMFTFGHFLPEIRTITEKHYYMPEFLRDVLAWKLAK